MASPEPFNPLGGRDYRSVFRETSSKPILVYFSEPENNLCRLINPTVENILKEHVPAAKHLSINTRDNKDITYEFNLTEAPSFLVYFRNEEIRRLTQIDYSDEFESEFREFVAGDFLFPRKSFNLVNERNFFSSLKEWYQLNLVCFMVPGDPINWQLEPILRDLDESFRNRVRVQLVNANKDESLLKHYKLRNLPSVILMDRTDVLEKWHPAASPKRIRDSVKEIAEASESSQ